jgi:signal transduction histidine kinase
MARNRSRGFEPTELAKLLDETLILLDRELRKYRISVEKRIENVPKVMANGNQIQQVILNLLINARQAMPDGGRLVLRLSYQPERGFVELLIRDSGCGIPADRLTRIFEPFYTTKSGPDETGKGGTGLGLASCRTIIEAHHGRIRVDSTPGKGTAFTIKLPTATTREGLQTGPGVAAASVSTGSSGPDQVTSP